jgi:hypothetical protein
MELLSMVLSRSLLIAALLIGVAPAFAKVYDAASDPFKREREQAEKRLCNSTAEYAKILRYIRDTEKGMKEDVARDIAKKVAKGCDGAASRFTKVLILLRTVGLSARSSMKMALSFANEHPDVQKNFVEIYTKAYLTEFFDYEYPKAMKLALDLSKGYKGDPAIARNDFIELVKFCKDSQKLDLPMRFCADYATKVAKLSQYYKEGVSKPFMSLFGDLRDKKEFSLDVRDALALSYQVLRHGPLAPKNFFEAFDLAIRDLGHDKTNSLEFAADLAVNSYMDDTPPILQFAEVRSPEEAAEQ